MRKHFILFSAIVMAAALATGCGNTTSTSSSTPAASQTESSSETESQTQELIEIDPFEDLNLVFYHQHNGEIMERDRGIYSETKCYRICSEHGCNMNYRFDMDDVKGEGESFPIRIVCTDLSSDATDEENINYVKEKYGILLTQASMDMVAKFEEDPIVEFDPFEDWDLVYTTDMSGEIYCDTDISECKGAHIISEHDCPVGYEAIYPEGKDEFSLTEGDIIKYTIVYSPDHGETIYKGEEAKEKIEEYQWYRLNITRTEYESIVDLSNSSSSSETEETTEE